MDSDRDNPTSPDVLNRPDGRPDPAAIDGVLSSLPRTRPQRASPRRAAQAKAKQADATTAAKARPRGKAAPKKSANRAATATPGVKKAAKRDAPKKRAARPQDAPPRPTAPKQGYETEEDLEMGRTVHPPSAVELAESVADIFLELASASLKSGGRVLKDALSPLRRSQG